MPKPEVDTVRARIQKRRQRLKRERKERAKWMRRGEGNGRSRDHWKRKNREGPLDNLERLVDTLGAVL